MPGWQSPQQRSQRARPKAAPIRPPERLTFGQRSADGVTAMLGSWRFIIWQSIILALWIALNTTGFLLRWDSPPFILLNLCLSFQAAFTGPVVLMSSNRQSEIDRQHVAHIEALTERAEALEEQLDALVEGMAKLLEADHVEHGRLLRELHSHTRCLGHTVIEGAEQA